MTEQALRTIRFASLVFGQTMPGKAVLAAGHAVDSRGAPSAMYDAKRSAKLFCSVANRWLLEWFEPAHKGLDAAWAEGAASVR